MLQYALPLTLLLTMGGAHAQTPAEPPEREAARARVTEAVQRKDYRAAIAAQAAWARLHPTDLQFRHIEPLLYRMAGDMAGWDRARSGLLTTWQRAQPTVETMDSSFTIDMLAAGPSRIVADQCYEQAGRFGVSYRLAVVDGEGRITSYFTVESPPSDNQIQRELGSNVPVYTLDYFKPGQHQTVARLPGPPVYQDVLQRALAHLADPKPISASGTGPGLASVGCEVATR